MPTKQRNPDRETEASELRRHRVRILFSLVGICRNIERLQISPVARRACRDVAGQLDAALSREIMPGRRRARPLIKA